LYPCTKSLHIDERKEKRQRHGCHERAREGGQLEEQHAPPSNAALLDAVVRADDKAPWCDALACAASNRLGGDLNGGRS